MPEIDRRRMMLTAGIGVLAAALPLPNAQASPRRPGSPEAPPPAAPSGQAGSYIFQDEFDGPAGSAPDGSKWAVAKARETIKDPTYWELPEHIGQYRDDRKNVFLDGNSNLVLRAAKDGPTYFSGKVQSLWRGGVGHTWEARIKLNCLTAGAWPAYWLGNDDQGEIDVMEWYGNGNWPSATTVHAKANGGEWKTHNIPVDSGWHTWRTQWDAAGIRFWKDYTDGAQPYFDVPASSLPDWPFNNPGYTVFPVFNLAVAGSGGGDPGPGTYPADMLIDWIRVW
ncbi:1,3-beta-glucanase [Mycobacterium paraense]|uniref:1,3-beta-glucanase n=1 Tax=Mycobacterium paraense TaxID=767916 RepID=A0ABX3VRQ3_9MYCO|nr:glycoside hydrolase family 16 protein [Mycobacterium paraense]MCV7443018.1 family 16 glycosylhydrolase [Mycobacterium paraense]ORW33137.1 1,3-beta-glucanase [Mycobacterium paraense]ORW38529.1 1,3-beta-glucanase [Mycobacterium paraense]ORW45997.1 1,3-beta-glucanase [Mycobacterium paraense]